MEAVANAAEDKLIDGLSFKLKPGASYITSRSSVSYHPQGSNHYSPTGTKVIKILLSGDQWLDPSTVRVMFDVHNSDSDPNKLLRPLGGPHTFFRRNDIHGAAGAACYSCQPSSATFSLHGSIPSQCNEIPL